MISRLVRSRKIKVKDLYMYHCMSRIMLLYKGFLDPQVMVELNSKVLEIGSFFLNILAPA